MGLVDGEFERGLKFKARFGFATELQVKFSEKDAGHHPVRFFRDAEFEVLHRIEQPVLGDESLREAEAEKLVVGLTRDEGGESLRTFHATKLSEVIHKNQYAGGVVQAAAGIRQIDDLAKDFCGL